MKHKFMSFKYVNFKEISKFIFSIIICQLVGLLGMFFITPSASVWYLYLIKPPFTPSGTIFKVIWILLFLLMGVGFYLILKDNFSEKKIKWAIVSFNIQLVLNFLWPVIFFGFKQSILAFIEILFLLGASSMMLWFYSRVNKTAAYLQIPYLLWIAFVAILNLLIIVLN